MDWTLKLKPKKNKYLVNYLVFLVSGSVKVALFEENEEVELLCTHIIFYIILTDRTDWSKVRG